MGEILIIMLITIGAGFVGYTIGVEDGRIEVASGEYQCHQLPDERWECYKEKPDG